MTPSDGLSYSFIEASLNISEQDNAQLPGIEQLGAGAARTGGVFLSKLLGQSGVAESLVMQATKDFENGISNLYNSYKTDGKTPLGSVAIVLKRNGIKAALETASRASSGRRISWGCYREE